MLSVLSHFFEPGRWGSPAETIVAEQALTAELHRLRGVFLVAGAGDHIEIESSFREAIFIARQQKSTSLARRAQATLAEYRRQKAGASGDYQFRLPL